MSRKNSGSVAPLAQNECEQVVEIDDLNLKKVNSKKSVVLFRIKKGIGFPHIIVIIGNLLLAIPLLLTVFVFLMIVAFTNPPIEPEEEMINNTVILIGPRAPDYGLPGKFYCSSFITWSILVEFFAQLIYSTGSGLLLAGTIKRRKDFCYAYVVCGIVSLVISAMIRASQFLICDKRQMTNTPGRIRPFMPQYIKFTFIWLVCQLFWYWLVLSLVAALLNWIQKEELKEERKRIRSAKSCSEERDKY